MSSLGLLFVAHLGEANTIGNVPPTTGSRNVGAVSLPSGLSGCRTKELWLIAGLLDAREGHYGRAVDVVVHHGLVEGLYLEALWRLIPELLEEGKIAEVRFVDDAFV